MFYRYNHLMNTWNGTAGERLVAARQLVGWSRSELARRAGQHIATVQALETGGSQAPSFKLVMAVVRALRRGGLRGLRPEDLFPLEEA